MGPNRCQLSDQDTDLDPRVRIQGEEGYGQGIGRPNPSLQHDLRSLLLRSAPLLPSIDFQWFGWPQCNGPSNFVMNRHRPSYGRRYVWFWSRAAACRYPKRFVGTLLQFFVTQTLARPTVCYQNPPLPCTSTDAPSVIRQFAQLGPQTGFVGFCERPHNEVRHAAMPSLIPTHISSCALSLPLTICTSQGRFTEFTETVPWPSVFCTLPEVFACMCHHQIF